MKFGGKKNEKRVTTPEETTFHLLHLSLLREYLDLEFTPLKSLLPFPYDLERIIDDWVRLKKSNQTVPFFHNAYNFLLFF